MTLISGSSLKKHRTYPCKELSAGEIIIHKAQPCPHGVCFGGKTGPLRNSYRAVCKPWTGGAHRRTPAWSREGAVTGTLSDEVTPMLGAEGSGAVGVQWPVGLDSEGWAEPMRCLLSGIWNLRVRHLAVTGVWRQEKGRGWSHPDGHLSASVLKILNEKSMSREKTEQILTEAGQLWRMPVAQREAAAFFSCFGS